MHIRYGYQIEVECEPGADLAFILDVHPDQRGDITQPDETTCETPDGAPVDASSVEKDRHGNLRRLARAPGGALRLGGEGVLFHNGFADEERPHAEATPPAALPPEVLPFLLASRCCPDDALVAQAWPLFRHAPDGWSRVQAICEYVHQKLRFAPDDPSSFRPASDVLAAGAGAIQDFAHVAIAFCRAIEIPARFCSGYVPSGGDRPGRCEGSFCAWFEAYLDGGWWTFDPWHAGPRIGRILVARGFDAADAPAAAGAGLRVMRLSCFAEPVEGARYPATARDRVEHWTSHNHRAGG